MNKFVTGVASAALLAVSTMALQAADTTMRISLQLPLKSHLGQNLLMFKEEVESKSGGDIAVEIYDSAQLYKDKEVPQAVGRRVHRGWCRLVDPLCGRRSDGGYFLSTFPV